MSTLGFDSYVEPLKMYLQKYREVKRCLLAFICGKKTNRFVHICHITVKMNILQSFQINFDQMSSKSKNCQLELTKNVKVIVLEYRQGISVVLSVYNCYLLSGREIELAAWMTKVAAAGYDNSLSSQRESFRITLCPEKT